MIPCLCPAQQRQSCSPTQSPETTFRLQSLRWSTFQRIPGEAQLAYDVSGNIGLDALAHLGLTLCSLQTLVKLLRVKLLQQSNGCACFQWTLNNTGSVFTSVEVVVRQCFTEGQIHSQCRVATLWVGLRFDKVSPAIFSLTNVIEGISTG